MTARPGAGETPTASPEVFMADLNRVTAALERAGAVIEVVDDDGTKHLCVALERAPAALLAVYRGLVRYGAANGYL